MKKKELFFCLMSSFTFAVYCKKLCIFVILAHLSIFQGKRTVENNGNFDAIDTIRKQIKFISDHFNFIHIWLFTSFWRIDENSSSPPHISNFQWLFNEIIFRKMKEKLNKYREHQSNKKIFQRSIKKNFSLCYHSISQQWLQKWLSTSVHVLEIKQNV